MGEGLTPTAVAKVALSLSRQPIATHSSILLNHGEHQVALATARAGNVIGGGDWAEDRLIPTSLRAIEAGQSVNIRNPHATRPWQHVLEPLNGYLIWLKSSTPKAQPLRRPSTGLR